MTNHFSFSYTKISLNAEWSKNICSSIDGTPDLVLRNNHGNNGSPRSYRCGQKTAVCPIARYRFVVSA